MNIYEAARLLYRLRNWVRLLHPLFSLMGIALIVLYLGVCMNIILFVFTRTVLKPEIVVGVR